MLSIVILLALLVAVFSFFELCNGNVFPLVGAGFTATSFFISDPAGMVLAVIGLGLVIIGIMRMIQRIDQDAPRG